VLVILIALAAVVVPMMGGVSQTTQLDATFATMTALRNAIMGTPNQPGYHQDMAGLLIPSGTLANAVSGGDPDYVGNNTTVPITIPCGFPWQPLDLFQNPTGATTSSSPATNTAQTFDPFTRKGWRGPYLQQTAGNSLFGQILDSYPPRTGSLVGKAAGQPIVIQWPPLGTAGLAGPRTAYIRLVSYGTNGVADAGYQTVWDPQTIQLNQQTTPGSMYQDDVILYLQTSPPTGTTPVTGPWTNYYDLKQQLQK